MFEEDVTQPSSAAPEAVEETSAPQEEQQAPETETATPQEAVTQEQEEQQEPQKEEEEARVPYSRLKEVVDEKNWYRQQLEQKLQPTPPAQPQETLPGQTPEEREFWRMVDKRADAIAEKKVNQIKPVIDAGLEELATEKVHRFRKEHPDIKKNSPEEAEIANRIQRGYLPDDAYWSVMGPRGIQDANQRAVKKVKQTVQQKKQANVESSPGVSPSVQAKPKESFDETFNKNYEKATKGEL